MKLHLALAIALVSLTHADELASNSPSPLQKDFINRGYGMFIQFGINTFNEIEWSYGDLPLESYKPTSP